MQIKTHSYILQYVTKPTFVCQFKETTSCYLVQIWTPDTAKTDEGNTLNDIPRQTKNAADEQP